MGGVLRPRGRTILPLLLSLLAGCSRPTAIRGSADSGQQTAPFREGEDNNPRPKSSVLWEPASDSESRIPFHDSESLPVGTLLTVRLTDAINSRPSASDPTASTTFVALVDEPVVIDGALVVPRGASVTGRVESTRVSTTKRDHGSVRLTLDQVDIAGRELEIRTSSLFARGDSVPSHARKVSDVVSVEQGRRLTFRLAEPATLAQLSDTRHP